MREVILSRYHGFCPGVRKAVETAYSVYGEGVYILGEIIHNETVVEKIRSLGTKVVDSPD